MPTRVNPTAVKKSAGYSPTQSFDDEGQVIDNQPSSQKAAPISSQTKGSKTAIRRVFGIRPRPKKGEGVSGLIIAMLLANKSTNEDILTAIAKKHGQETADIWTNRITIFRSDINAGRRVVNKVKELGVKLPLLRLIRQGKQLVPAEPRKRYGVRVDVAPVKMLSKSPVKSPVVAKQPVKSKGIIPVKQAVKKVPAKVVPLKKSK